MNLLTSLHLKIIKTIQECFTLAEEQTTNISVELNTTKPKEFGDLNCNAAMVLAKELKLAPRAIAEQITQTIKDSEELSKYIASVEIAGPGFLNLYFHQATWNKIAEELFSSGEDYFKLINTEEKRKFLLEFVSANPTGPLHLGHGRNAIIGDVLGRILRFLGHQADAEFYINDAGSQIAKLGNSLKIRCQQATGQDIPFPEDGYAGDYLVTMAEELIKEEGNNVVEKDVTFFADYAKAQLLEYQKETLSMYQITFDNWYSEKTLHESGKIKEAIQLLEEKGLIYEDEGALWFKATNFGDDKDRVIKKADGTLTYIAADIAYHKEKFDRKYNTLIDILGQDHHSYVTRLKATMKAIDYDADNLDVILYQLVSIKQSGEQVKMSKRAGVFEGLRDVIEKVGTDVARFFYLNRKADAHLEFDLDVALKKTEENPVYYIQYAYVRTNSLLAKVSPSVKTQEHENLKNLEVKPTDLNDDDITVLKKICALHSLLRTIAKSYQTHLLSYYTFELAKLFHAYYGRNKIIIPEDVETTQTRLFTTKLIQKTLALCLDLLGLQKPERM